MNIEKKQQVVKDIVEHVIDTSPPVRFGTTTVQIHYKDGEITGFDVQTKKAYRLHRQRYEVQGRNQHFSADEVEDAR